MYPDYPIRKIYGVEIAGACNLESTCSWCPMHNRPRSRKRGLMDDKVLERALHWVKTLGSTDALALHNFGEPLLHPKFDTIALEFSKLAPITMSTNGVLLDDQWANRLAKVPWAWITISPWDKPAMFRAGELLKARGVKFEYQSYGVTHNFAGQAIAGPTKKIFKGCDFLRDRSAVIRWNGDLASCCISDREEDKLGTVFEEPESGRMHRYSICETCHHAV